MKKYYFWFKGKCYETMQDSEYKAERYFAELFNLRETNITVFTLEKDK